MKILILAAAVLCVSMPGFTQDGDVPTYENQHFQAAYDYLFTDEEQSESSALVNVNNQRKLNAFWERVWKKRDPTPETEYNSLRQLFIQRVDDTRLFAGTYDDGFGDDWKKDQGRVYIIYGAPDEIVKSPYGPKETSNIEVWIYREKGNKDSKKVEIIFVEGIDQFKLQTSITFPRTIMEERVLPDVPSRFEER